MKAICGADCEKCYLNKQEKCKGCRETKGCPFGKKCWIAQYIEISEEKGFESFKENLIKEINSLNIEDLPRIENLYPLHGSFVNLEYTLPNGEKIKFLDDNDSYLGNQIEYEYNDDEAKRFVGIIANMDFILISEYGEDGENPNILLFKKR